MKQLSRIFLIFMMSFLSNQAISQETENVYTTYYLIRHAEKDTLNPQERNPELTPEGIERADQWAALFSKITFDEIYSTDYKRTVNTAKPIALSQNIKIKYYHPKEVYRTDFLTATHGKTVLIVGHSNTIPVFANYILFAGGFLPSGKYSHQGIQFVGQCHALTAGGLWQAVRGVAWQIVLFDGNGNRFGFVALQGIVTSHDTLQFRKLEHHFGH